MKQKQFTEEQVIGILKNAETGMVVTELCRKHGITINRKQTQRLYRGEGLTVRHPGYNRVQSSCFLTSREQKRGMRL